MSRRLKQGECHRAIRTNRQLVCSMNRISQECDSEQPDLSLIRRTANTVLDALDLRDEHEQGLEMDGQEVL